MKLYRIYTENKNREEIEKLVGKHFDGFTVFEARGYWKGVRENALVIEILTHKWDYKEGSVEKLADEIRYANKQESVLFTEQEVKATFV